MFLPSPFLVSTFLIGMFNTFTTLKSLCWWARTVEVAILTAFQSLSWRFYSHIFLLSFWSGSCFHNCYWPPQQLSISCHWLFLTKALRPGFSWRSSSELHSGQMTTMNRALPGSWTTRQIGTMLWEWAFFFVCLFLRCPKQALPTQWLQACCFSRLLQTWAKRDGSSSSCNATNPAQWDSAVFLE